MGCIINKFRLYFFFLRIKSNMNDRQLKEIYFSMYYNQVLNHGTDGHNRLIIMAELAAKNDYWIDVLQARLYHKDVVVLDLLVPKKE